MHQITGITSQLIHLTSHLALCTSQWSLQCSWCCTESDFQEHSIVRSSHTMTGWFMTLTFALGAQIFLQCIVSGFQPSRSHQRKFQGIKLESSTSDEPMLRIGHGFDIHRLIEGTKLIIGQVSLPHFSRCTLEWNALTTVLLPNTNYSQVELTFHSMLAPTPIVMVMLCTIGISSQNTATFPCFSFCKSSLMMRIYMYFWWRQF